LLPAGADPFSFYKDGFYYYTHTTGKNITLWKTNSIANLKTAEKKIVFTPLQKALIQKNCGRRKFILYKTNGISILQQTAVIITNTVYGFWKTVRADPLQGEWIMKGKLETPDDKWSIDGSVFENKGQLIVSGPDGKAMQMGSKIFISQK
jgi:GH43 family beta-xylosidase